MDNKSLFSWIGAKLEGWSLSLERIVAAAFSSLMVAYLFQLLNNGAFDDLNAYYNSISFFLFYVVAVMAFAMLIGLTAVLKMKQLIPWSLIVCAVAVSVLFVVNISEVSAYFSAGVGLADLIIVLWVVRGDKLGLSALTVSRRVALIAAGVLFVASTLIFGWYTSLRYRTFNNFDFDFGIFAQMYERMAATGLPHTTVERLHDMSHFGVHFSPIFYLFLPIYYIFRSPICLFYIQSASVAAGVFAVYLIAGKMGFSGKMTLALELIYTFYPCLINGTFYDFHENKFLTTIILFLFYFILSKRFIPTLGMSLLLLSVKEDAAIYLICIALFVMVYRKEVFQGLIMLGMAIVYFIIAQAVVSAMGTEGVMISRLGDYFVNGEQGFGSVIQAVFYDMGFLIKQMFLPDKIPFILWMFAPVAFSPFMTKKISALFLLFPIIPINLMQSWKYQYDVDYQYTYGVAALILMSMILVIGQLKKNPRRVVVLTSLCLCAVMSAALIVPKMQSGTKYMSNYDQEDWEAMYDICDSIPSSATVNASSSVVPHLYRVEKLYAIHDYDDNSQRDTGFDTDYYVLDTRYDLSLYKEKMGDHYDLIRSEGFIELYQRR